MRKSFWARSILSSMGSIAGLSTKHPAPDALHQVLIWVPPAKIPAPEPSCALETSKRKPQTWTEHAQDRLPVFRFKPGRSRGQPPRRYGKFVGVGKGRRGVFILRNRAGRIDRPTLVPELRGKIRHRENAAPVNGRHSEP